MRQRLDLLQEPRAAAEARRDLLVLGACRPPAQDPSFERAQDVALQVSAAAGMLGQAPDSRHPLGAALEPTGNLGVVDALLGEPEDSTLNGPKRAVIRHGCLLAFPPG